MNTLTKTLAIFSSISAIVLAIFLADARYRVNQASEQIKDLQAEIAAIKLSSAISNKIVDHLTTNLTSCDQSVKEAANRITKIEGEMKDCSDATQLARKTEKDIVSLTRSTQAAFDQIGPIIDDIKRKLKSLLDQKN